jgi:hypothetical protein
MATGFAAVPRRPALRARRTPRCRRCSSTASPAGRRRRSGLMSPTSSSRRRIEADRPRAGDHPGCRFRSRPRHGLAVLRRHAHPPRQGPHLAAPAEPDGTFDGRARRRGGRPRAATGRRRRRRRMDFACAGLRPRHRRSPHPHRLRSRRSTRSRGRCSPRCASAGPAASTCRRCPSSAIDQFLDARLLRRDRRRSPPHGGVLGAVTYMIPGPRPGHRSMHASAPPTAASTSTSTSTRPTIPRAARCATSPMRRSRTGFPGEIVAGHCCSLAGSRTRGRGDAGPGGEAGIAVVSLPMCNMYLQDRHRRRSAVDAALARRHAAARDEGAPGASRRGRLRQHPRSLLRLWRPRHAGGLPRGDRILHLDHPVARLAGGRRRARRPTSSGGRTAASSRRRARRPRPLPRPHWTNCCRARRATARAPRAAAIDTDPARLPRTRRPHGVATMTLRHRRA